MSLVYGSVCSGIEAATVAAHPLGWRPAFYSEIEPFPRAVLTHHYPQVPLHGDFTTIRAGEYEPIDLLVGGTPCQSFSVAGLRGGLDDDRGNLALEYLRLADRLRPRWLVWENVPGVLSSNGGRDFGSILGGMGELGYGVAYRVLDAQYFGLAQRRRRVFVVGYLGDWRRAAAVLLERHSLSGNPAPSREAREGSAPSPSLRARANSSHRADSQAFIPEIGYALNAHGGAHGGAHGRQDAESETLIAHSLRGEGFDASEDGTGRGTPIVPVWSVTQDSTPVVTSNMSPALKIGTGLEMGQPPCIAFALRGREGGAMPEVGGDHVGALRSASGGSSRDYVAFPINPNALRGDTHAKTPSLDAAGVMRLRDPGLGIGDAGDPADTLLAAGPGAVGTSSAVRRLVPEECEALQGFSRGYTNIPWRGKPNAPDGPRYKALGNSMAVPCMAWIFQRIAAVEALPHEDELEDGRSNDDANDTLDGLISQARELENSNQGKGL